jgi:hypothetical protein
VIDKKGEKPKLVIVEASFRGQAERFLKKEAKKEKGILTTVGVM